MHTSGSFSLMEVGRANLQADEAAVVQPREADSHEDGREAFRAADTRMGEAVGSDPNLEEVEHPNQAEEAQASLVQVALGGLTTPGAALTKLRPPLSDPCGLDETGFSDDSGSDGGYETCCLEPSPLQLQRVS